MYETTFTDSTNHTSALAFTSSNNALYMWQSQVEIEHYFIANSYRITVF